MALGSVVSLIGNYDGPCGYCRDGDAGSQSEEKRDSFGIISETMTVGHYNALCDRGWRRCGTLYYKPANESTCCPQYTIRLDCQRHQPTPSQKKVLRRVQRYLSGDWEPNGGGGNKLMDEARLAEEADGPRAVLEGVRDAVTSASQGVLAAAVEAVAGGAVPEDVKAMDAQGMAFQVNRKFTNGHVSSSQALRAVSLLGKVGVTVDQAALASTIAAALRGRMAGDERVSEIRATGGYVNVVVANIGEKVPKGKRGGAKKPEPSGEGARRGGGHTLEMELVPAVFREDTFDVYRKYQIHTHGDEPDSLTPDQYTNFLCNAKFTVPDDSNAPFKGYGGYHLIYKVDGRIAGVSVLDVLPSCLSSVYFFYDPDFSFLSLGVYSALNEIQMVAEESQKVPEFKYYYMGYYIHSCPKMTYKANYLPSELLCPVTNRFYDAEAVKTLLDKKRFCNFSREFGIAEGRIQPSDPELKDGLTEDEYEAMMASTIVHVPVVVHDMKMTVGQIMPMIQNPKFVEVIQDYVANVGFSLALEINIKVA